MNDGLQELDASGEILRAIAQSARDAIFIVDDKGDIVFANDSTRQLFGYTAGELVGEPVTRLIPLDIRQRHEKAFKSAARPGSSGAVGGTYEFMAVHKSGDSVPVDITLSMWESGNHRFFSGIARDISERKRAETILHQSRESLDTILNSMDAVVYITDMDDHEVLFINDYGKLLFGDIVGKTCWSTLQKGQTGPCDFCTNDQLLDERGKPTAGVVWDFQNTVNRRWYECRDRAIRWFDGRIVRMEIATDITDKKALESKLLAMAERDPLVSLPNRTLLLERLDQAVKLAHRRQEAVAVLFIDLDGFKPVNDLYGHRVGDLCLIEMAQRLSGSVRESDTLARFGGDEFVLLLQSDITMRAAERVAQKLIDEAAKPMDLEGIQICLGASIGIAFYPEHGENPDQLIRRADAAMYRAKEERGRYAIATEQEG